MKKTFVYLSLLIIVVLSISAILSKGGFMRGPLRTPTVALQSGSVMTPALPGGPLKGSAGFKHPTPRSKPVSGRKNAATEAGTEVKLPEGVSKNWWAEAQKNIKKAEYNISRTKSKDAGIEATYQAPNRANNLRTYFTDEGIVVVPRTGDANAWNWGLRPLGISEESSRLTVNGNRVEYVHGPPNGM